MKMHYVFILSFLLVFSLTVCGSGEDALGGTKSNPGIDVKNPGVVEKEKSGGIEKKLNPVVKNDKVVGDDGGLPNGSEASKDGLKKETTDAVDKKSDGKKQGDTSEQKEKKNVVEDPKEGLKTDGGKSGTPDKIWKKEKPVGEECDMSNRCTDKGNTLVACLRVPGNEATELSLLIQNKGKGTMVVKISVPTLVEVGKTNVELKENGNEKIKVTLKKGVKDGDIKLSTGASSCSLNLKSLIANINSGEKVAISPKSKYLTALTETKSLSFMFLGLIAIIASIVVWIILRKKHHLSKVPNYQKLDTELPVSIGREQILNTSDVHDGWDNGWDDNWDDEEAPMSPMPVTPSISSKGLASRKFNKD